MNRLTDMAEPSQLPVRESLPRFMLAWLPVIVVPAAITFAPALLLIIYLLITGDASTHNVSGWVVVGYALAFGCAAAASQWWALRRRLPRAGLWGITTVAGASGATLAYLVAQGTSLSNDGGRVFADSTGVVAGIVFGLILAVVQSRALVAPFHWSHRFQWIVVSVLAGGLASGLTRVFDVFNNETLTLSASELPSPQLWILYALVTGIAMHRLIMWTRHRQQDAVSARFD